MSSKQGRTSCEEIRQRIREVRSVINRKTGEAPDKERAEYLSGWAQGFRDFAAGLEGREDVATDHAVKNWPKELRSIAEECESAAGVFEKAPAARSAEETMYPGMVKEG